MLLDQIGKAIKARTEQEDTGSEQQRNTFL